jgi:hypothetical protein
LRDQRGVPGGDNLSDLLPDAIISVLYKETKVGDDVLGLRAKQQWLQAPRRGTYWISENNI